MSTLDEVLDQRIGMGRTQYKQFAILSFVDFMDGFSIVFLSILVSLLKAQWGLTLYQVIFLSSIYYFGVALGKLFQGYFSDIIGRANLLIITMGAMLLTLFLHIFIHEFWDVFFLRFLFGFEFGITIPLAQVLLCESTPSKYRGRVVSLLQLFFIFGILYLLLSSQVFLKNFEEGNWKGLIMFNLIPTAICFFGCILILRESPRFSLIKGNFQLAFQRLREMGFENKSQEFQDISKEEKDELILWSFRINLSHQGQKKISDLFQHRQMSVITITLWAMMMIWSLQSKGTLMILPFVYTSAGYGFNAMLLAHSAEIIAVILAFGLIDSKTIGGRKGTLYIAITIYMCAQLSIYFRREEGVFLGAVLIRFADRLTWICIHQAKMECYTTYYRTFGLGFAQFLGFNAAALAPFIFFPLYYIDPYLPFLIVAIFSVPLIISVLIHPVNLTQKVLDDQTILEKHFTP